MIWFIALGAFLLWGLASFLGGNHYHWASPWAFEDIMMTYVVPFFLFGALFSVFGVLLASGLAFGIGNFMPQEKVLAGTWHLEAIRDKDGVSGQFFLGSGSIKGEQYYFYYWKDRDGALHPDRVTANSAVTIVEADTEKAMLRRYSWEFTNRIYNMFGISSPNSLYEFIVPPNTVRRGFTM